MSAENGEPAECRGKVPTVWKFEQGQRVKITGLESWPARIIARADYGNHHKYLVLWWINSQRHEEWLRDIELEAS